MNEPQSLNQYAYCHNNPVMYVDPSGYLTIPRGVATIAIDTLVLTIAGWAPAAWLAFTAPVKAMGKAAANAWLKTTFKSGLLRF